MRMRVERETLGVELYGIQQQLVRQQMLMEQEQDKHITLHQLRVQREGTLAQVREMYCSMQEQVKRERQVNPLNGREHYGMTLHTNVKMYMYSELKALSKLD